MLHIRLLFDYGCLPIWYYDDEGDEDKVYTPEIPEEWASDTAFVKMWEDISEKYMSLFINNVHEFSYAGFSTPDEKQEFVDDVHRAIDMLMEKCGDKHVVKNDLEADLQNL